MTYCLHWTRPPEIERQTFLAIVADFKEVLPHLKKTRVRLAGSYGHGVPKIDEFGICFNGAIRCGHRHKAPDISGSLREFLAEDNAPEGSDSRRAWGRRRCPGTCAFDTFLFARIDWNPHGGGPLQKSSCKTNRRHYELAAQIVLLIAKNYLGKQLSLEGFPEHWLDARRICQRVLGYGLELNLFEEAPLQPVAIFPRRGRGRPRSQFSIAA